MRRIAWSYGPAATEALTPLDRRSFLRRAGAVVLTAPVATLAGCDSEVPAEAVPPSVPMTPVPSGDIVRPILFPLADDAVWMDSPAREMPVAYVSMRTRQLFVDSAFRDQVFWDLRAHISVSTGVWRIPLVGDPPRMEIVPGDVLREFEELSEREWDPAEPPAPGDIRIVRGIPTSRHVEVACMPLAGGGMWLRAGPWDVVQAVGPAAEFCREDFESIGQGMRFADRDCTRPRGEVDVMTWVVRTATDSAGA